MSGYMVFNAMLVTESLRDQRRKIRRGTWRRGEPAAAFRGNFKKIQKEPLRKKEANWAGRK